MFFIWFTAQLNFQCLFFLYRQRVMCELSQAWPITTKKNCEGHFLLKSTRQGLRGCSIMIWELSDNVLFALVILLTPTDKTHYPKTTMTMH